MYKGISSFYGYPDGMKEKFAKIKEAGFTHIIMDAGKKYERQNGKLKDQVKEARRLGLKLSSLHSSYNEQHLHYFWEEGSEGEEIKKLLIKELKLCKKYDFSCLVIHFKGDLTEIGLNRIRDILKVCHKLKKPIAVENIDVEDMFFYINDNILDEYLKVCYDIGHHNVFCRDAKIIEKYHDRIACFHLHNNEGLNDLHTVKEIAKLPDVKYSKGHVDGERHYIDWDNFARLLAEYNIDIPLDYELINSITNTHDYDQKWMLETCFDEALYIEKKVEEYNKKI